MGTVPVVSRTEVLVVVRKVGIEASLNKEKMRAVRVSGLGTSGVRCQMSGVGIRVRIRVRSLGIEKSLTGLRHLLQQERTPSFWRFLNGEPTCKKSKSRSRLRWLVDV